MPRQSAEARAAAYVREGGRRPAPPVSLDDDARVVWNDVVGTRPPDYFQPGSLHLLEQFCVLVIAARRVSEIVQKVPNDEDMAKLYSEYAQRCAMHATKLRLSIQTEVDRKSGKLDERESTERDKPGINLLMGGDARH